VQFRKDINGLRAIAVIAVVLFHFNASWMPGGFAGVDVFFVISGFLMTGIIFKGIEQENFSILRFYTARANRIIPALAVLCLVLLVLGWFYLTPSDYKALGKHVGSSIVFLSNIIYLKESGYFDPASHEKWLLHTWSLSAEWQFYIIYPLVLLVLKKFMSLNTMRVTVLVGTVLGFIFCIIATYKWPNPSYYLLPARAWEMMIGGVAYLFPFKLTNTKKKVFEWTGLALITLSYIFISKENLWPGYLAAIPVLGAFLLIQAQRNDSIITSNIIIQSLGKWSYSIYLWHWPLVVALSYFHITNFKILVFVIILCALLGFLSYTHVEMKKWSYKTLISLFVLQISVFIFIDSQSYWPNYSSRMKSIEKEADLFQNVYSNPECNFRALKNGKVNEEKINIKSTCYEKKSGRSILLYGDSHAQHLRPGIEHYFSEVSEIYQVATFSCQIQMLDHGKKGCIRSNELFWREIEKNKPDVLIISQYDGYEKVNWKNMLSDLAYLNNVIIIGPSPLYTGFFKYQLDKIKKPYNYDYIKKTDSTMLKLAKGYRNVEYISAYENICSENGCKLFVDNKFSMLADGSHFTRDFSKYFINKIIYERVSKILNQDISKFGGP